jgi:hypothetical protein
MLYERCPPGFDGHPSVQRLHPPPRIPPKSEAFRRPKTETRRHFSIEKPAESYKPRDPGLLVQPDHGTSLQRREEDATLRFEASYEQRTARVLR